MKIKGYNLSVKIAEVILNNGEAELIFDGLMKKEDFKLILDQFIGFKEIKVIEQTEDELGKACLLTNGEFEFVLVYSSDSFVWNYAYAVKKENHKLLKALCAKFAEVV